MTDLKTRLSAFSVDVDTLFAPYCFVLEHQNDACEIDAANARLLIDLVNAFPHIAIVDLTHSNNLRVRYASRCEHDNYLFLEIDQIDTDRFCVTSFVDSFDYFSGYLQ